MTRVPRMHALPWQTAGLTLMCSFQFIDSMASRLQPTFQGERGLDSRFDGAAAWTALAFLRASLAGLAERR